MSIEVKKTVKLGLMLFGIGTAFPMIASLYGRTEIDWVNRVAGASFLLFYFTSFLLWIFGGVMLLVGGVTFVVGRKRGKFT